jgi:hypothetical protein
MAFTFSMMLPETSALDLPVGHFYGLCHLLGLEMHEQGGKAVDAFHKGR